MIRFCALTHGLSSASTLRCGYVNTLSFHPPSLETVLKRSLVEMSRSTNLLSDDLPSCKVPRYFVRLCPARKLPRNQYFDTVGWVFTCRITYVVLLQTLNHAQSKFPKITREGGRRQILPHTTGADETCLGSSCLFTITGRASSYQGL